MRARRTSRPAWGSNLEPGRIYAGLTGATKWPSGKVGKMTLGDRIGRNHLRGTIRGSTFRRTLAALLRRRLGLGLGLAGRLTAESEGRLSLWMRDHLAVAVYPFAERDALASLEQEALAALDPPLNLDHMKLTPVPSYPGRVPAQRAWAVHPRPGRRRGACSPRSGGKAFSLDYPWVVVRNESGQVFVSRCDARLRREKRAAPSRAMRHSGYPPWCPRVPSGGDHLQPA